MNSIILPVGAKIIVCLVNRSAKIGIRGVKLRNGRVNAKFVEKNNKEKK